MYDIVQEEVESVNGLGGNGNFWNAAGNVLNLVNTGADAASKIITATKQGKQPENVYYVGGNTPSPTVYTPPVVSTPPTQPVYTVPSNNNNSNSTEEKKDYLPWIIGGAVAVVGLFFFMNNNKRRR